MAKLKGEKWRRDSFPNHRGTEDVVFSMHSSNRIQTADQQTNTLELQVWCGLVSRVEIDAWDVESDDVRVAFDKETLVRQKWRKPLKNVLVPSTDQDQYYLVAHLMNSTTFNFEYIPKGGTPQLATFNMADLSSLMDKENACSSWLKLNHSSKGK
jgi:hypothetical protein